MNIAPLQLKYYFITELYIKARPKYEPKKGWEQKFEHLQCSTKFLTKKDNPLLRQVHLTLNYNPPATVNAPYDFKITIVGFFEIDSRWQATKRDELVQFNAPAMLYSAAREIIATITGRGPWEEIILPSVNFLVKNKNKC